MNARLGSRGRLLLVQEVGVRLHYNPAAERGECAHGSGCPRLGKYLRAIGEGPLAGKCSDLPAFSISKNEAISVLCSVDVSSHDAFHAQHCPLVVLECES